MRYNMGINLSDFGFGFLENLHEPIFLIHRFGKIVKMNEAARKLLRIARSDKTQTECFIQDHLLRLFEGNDNPNSYRRMSFGRKGHQIVARNLKESDYILVEVLK